MHGGLFVGIKKLEVHIHIERTSPSLQRLHHHTPSHLLGYRSGRTILLTIEQPVVLI